VVTKGDAAGKDWWGQMAIVSRHVCTQLEIMYRDAAGELKTPQKQPAELADAGLSMKRNLEEICAAKDVHGSYEAKSQV
jgi:S-formylglutathione hydrolase FrmB